MSRAFVTALLVCSLMLAACATGKEQAAVSQTLAQARVDLQCRELTQEVLSKKMSMTPVPEARFTISVTGCEKKAVYDVACQEFGED